jgi:hypothetical protein
MKSPKNTLGRIKIAPSRLTYSSFESSELPISTACGGEMDRDVDEGVVEPLELKTAETAS